MKPRVPRPPPPSASAPISRDVVDIVKKKLSQPSGPPPRGLMNFKQPKSVTNRPVGAKSIRLDDDDEVDEDDEDEEIDNRRDYDYEDEDEYDDRRNNNYNYKADSKIPKRNSYNENISRNSSNKDYERSNSIDNNSETVDTKKAEKKSTEVLTNESKVNNNNEPQIYNFQPLLKATYRELRTFAMTPCAQNTYVKCYIERDRSGINTFSPFYSLCADMDDGTGRELIVCRKIWQSRSPHYVFSLKSDDLYVKRDQRSRLYLGKLRGITPDDYVLYDNGICMTQDGDIVDDEQTEDEILSQSDAKTFSSENGKEGESLYRKELAIIHLNSKKRPPPVNVRGTEVCIQSGSSVTMVPTFQKIRETGKQNIMNASKLFIINERTSKYDPLSACLVDFRGRATVPSIKNCQFVASDPTAQNSEYHKTDDSEKHVLLEMGKTAEDCYNMTFTHPLSLLQAFAICVSRFDAKLTW
eukprot:CAMPEP_0196767940 /NCGR_PEP_ID=MMETSP1095-20130614/42144_1 /TAXON_ID=96789 ORGANISM="Chromulina nebulosa, Strain UTEXLB2642" /NCGR_SAMPLE_ID=MMETSP1095 /ASSEMBLY_ACC=CAM_ASM_000446 /LENGTH=468 /DNA_ID=CAMNT_0042136819 /DNA_START=1841 /DNA_END=3244 /DNA_ORIENTATION=-